MRQKTNAPASAETRQWVAARATEIAQHNYKGFPTFVKQNSIVVESWRVNSPPLGTGFFIGEEAFLRRGPLVFVLLAGGGKRTQDADIERAAAIARE